MTEPAGRAERPPRRAGFSSTVRDELAKLRGRNLGTCAACEKPVFFEQNFTRYMGRVIHVSCPISARTRTPLAVDAVVARHLASHDR